MTTSEQVVRALFDAWSRFDIDKIISFFAEDAVWDNVPQSITRGPGEIRALMEVMKKLTPTVDVKIVNLIANGRLVAAEREDSYTLMGTPITLRVVGIFEIDNGKISAWREYFDEKKSGIDLLPPDWDLLQK